MKTEQNESEIEKGRHLRLRRVVAELREGSAMAFALGRGSSPAAVANGLERGWEREKMGLGSAL